MRETGFSYLIRTSRMRLFSEFFSVDTIVVVEFFAHVSSSLDAIAIRPKEPFGEKGNVEHSKRKQDGEKHSSANEGYWQLPADKCIVAATVSEKVAEKDGESWVVRERRIEALKAESDHVGVVFGDNKRDVYFFLIQISNVQDAHLDVCSLGCQI